MDIAQVNYSSTENISPDRFRGNSLAVRQGLLAAHTCVHQPGYRQVLS